MTASGARAHVAGVAGSSGRGGVAPSGRPRTQGPSDILATAAPFGSPAQVVIQEGLQKLASAEAAPAAKKRRGLSPYMLFLNRMLAAGKQSKGAALSLEEVSRVRAQARFSWDALEDKSAHEELHQVWQETPAPTSSSPQQLPFKAMWAGGCRASPTSATELHKHYCSEGWPSHDEVHIRKLPYVSADSTVDWAASRGIDLFGCERMPLSICRKDMESAAFEGFSLVHAGLCNVLESLPKAESQGGQVMFVAEGRLVATPHTICRWAFMVTGVCWSPKVFDATMQSFQDRALESAEELATPFDLCISRRASKVSDRFRCINVAPSGALVRHFVLECSHVCLYKAQYSILLGGGTLNWSHVSKVENLGVLLEPGLQRPVLADEAAAKRRADRSMRVAVNLRQGDPLSTAMPANQHHKRPSAKAKSERGRQRRDDASDARPAAHVGPDGALVDSASVATDLEAEATSPHANPSGVAERQDGAQGAQTTGGGKGLL